MFDTHQQPALGRVMSYARVILAHASRKRTLSINEVRMLLLIVL